jgi:hypothetical protein
MGENENGEIIRVFGKNNKNSIKGVVVTSNVRPLMAWKGWNSPSQN